MEEIPPKCKEKIIKSTANPGWNSEEERGGYTVQPVPPPIPINEEESRKNIAGTSNQNLKLFIRGKCISL